MSACLTLNGTHQHILYIYVCVCLPSIPVLFACAYTPSYSRLCAGLSVAFCLFPFWKDRWDGSFLDYWSPYADTSFTARDLYHSLQRLLCIQTALNTCFTRWSPLVLLHLFLDAFVKKIAILTSTLCYWVIFPLLTRQGDFVRLILHLHLPCCHLHTAWCFYCILLERN